MLSKVLLFQGLVFCSAEAAVPFKNAILESQDILMLLLLAPRFFLMFLASVAFLLIGRLTSSVGLHIKSYSAKGGKRLLVRSYPTVTTM